MLQAEASTSSPLYRCGSWDSEVGSGRNLTPTHVGLSCRLQLSEMCMAASLSHWELSRDFPLQSPGDQAPISETLSSISSGPLEAGLASGFVASAWLQRKPHSMHVARTRRMQREIRARLGVSESHGLIPRLVFTPGVSQLRLHASPINCEISSSEPVTTLLLQEILFQVCSMCAITWGRTDIYI